MITFVLGFIVGVAAYLAYDYFTSHPAKVEEVEAEVKKDVTG